MERVNSTYFYCFSPLVMLVTFLIEISAALYIIWRYKMTVVTRLIVAILVLLATFQGAEYMLCGGMGIAGGSWSQLGYSAITLLPPLGLHLSHAIAGKKNPLLIRGAYATAVVFIGYFAFFTGAISGHTCYANYVVFEGSQNAIPHLAYALYYYGWLFVGVWTSITFALQQVSPQLKSALIALAVGYCAFIIPTTTVNIIDPSTIAGIPSIMCGFAVLLALVLVGKVAPDAIATSDRRSVWIKLPF